MSIFSEELKFKITRGLNICEEQALDIRNSFWLLAIMWLAAVFGITFMSLFGIVGLNTWSLQCSAANPGVPVDQTVIYWIFMFAYIACKFVVTMMTVFMVIIFFFVVRSDNRQMQNSRQKNYKAICPKCQAEMVAFRGDTRLIYYCDKCKKHFVKRGE